MQLFRLIVYIFAALVPTLAAAALISRITVEARLHLYGSEAEIRLKIGVFFGLIRIAPVFRLEYVPKRGIVFFSVKKRGLKPLSAPDEAEKRTQKQLSAAALSVLRTRRLEASGELGLCENAALCVFLCGTLEILLSAALCIGTAVFLDDTGEAAPLVRIFPDFSRNAFNLNLVWIAETNTAKLLKSLLWAYAKTKKPNKQKRS